MKNRGVAETPAVMASRRQQHADYVAEGWTLVLGLNGKMRSRMIRIRGGKR